MARKRHHYKRRVGATYEIDVTTFLNLMVVLVPFLLITAVFSRLTIVELNLPSAAGGPANDADNFRVEVIVREAGMEISNGRASGPKSIALVGPFASGKTSRSTRSTAFAICHPKRLPAITLPAWPTRSAPVGFTC